MLRMERRKHPITFGLASVTIACMSVLVVIALATRQFVGAGVIVAVIVVNLLMPIVMGFGEWSITLTESSIKVRHLYAWKTYRLERLSGLETRRGRRQRTEYIAVLDKRGRTVCKLRWPGDPEGSPGHLATFLRAASELIGESATD